VGHEPPNKAPLLGLLCYLDAASEHPVGGAKGRLIYIPSSVGVPALETLVGMGVNVRSDLSGHNPRFKIGVIEKAYAGDALEDGSIPVHVEGYLYAKDFADEVDDLKAEKDDLGFSYEASAVLKDVEGASPATAQTTSLVFTGATILYKKKAAYTKTSLAAEGDEQVNEEELKKALEAMGLGNLEDYVAMFKDIKKAMEEKGVYASMSMYLSAAAEARQAVDTLTTQLADVTEKLDASNAKVAELETSLNAANERIAKVEPLAAHADSLKAEAEAKAEYARRSVAFPASLMAKFDHKEGSDLQAELAEVSRRADLDAAQKIALKMEIEERYNAQNSK